MCRFVDSLSSLRCRGLSVYCVGGLLVHSIVFLLHGVSFNPPIHGTLIRHFLCHVGCVVGPSSGFMCPSSGTATGFCFCFLRPRFMSIVLCSLAGPNQLLCWPVPSCFSPPTDPCLLSSRRNIGPCYCCLIFRRSSQSPPSEAHLVYVPGVSTTITRFPAIVKWDSTCLVIVITQSGHR